MAEEPKVISNNNVTQDPPPGDPSKQTNTTFTQSDVDKMIKKEVAKATEGYSDYDSVKSEFDKMKKEKEDRELSKKTELEKRDIEIGKLKDSVDKMKVEQSLYDQQKIRSKVLSDESYKDLPEVYRSSILLSDNEGNVKVSADEVLEKYKSDFKQKSQPFGVPPKIPVTTPTPLETKGRYSAKETFHKGMLARAKKIVGI